MEYTTPPVPQLNRVMKRIFAVVKEGALSILLNAKLNETAHQMLWGEDVHTCECVRNSMDTIDSTKSPFEKSYELNPKIVSSLL